MWDEDVDPWRVKGVTRAFENDWFGIDSYDVVRPDGAAGYYDVIRARRVAVGVLPIEADGTVHMVGQWRFPLGAPAILGNAGRRRGAWRRGASLRGA